MAHIYPYNSHNVAEMNHLKITIDMRILSLKFALVLVQFLQVHFPIFLAKVFVTFWLSLVHFVMQFLLASFSILYLVLLIPLFHVSSFHKHSHFIPHLISCSTFISCILSFNSIPKLECKDLGILVKFYFHAI